MGYRTYIHRLGLDSQTAYGQCEVQSKAMKEFFPELKLVRGHFDDAIRGKCEHWWLTDEQGNIIDPTRIQFCPVGEYIPWDESAPEPTGKCPNCGEYCYHGNGTCSDKCSKEYLSYLNNC